MRNPPLVLVAIDHSTDVKRAVAVASSLAGRRGGDVDVIDVVSPSAMPSDSRAASLIRPVDERGVRLRTVTLRGTPERALPAYSQVHQATLLVVERDYGSWRFWRNGAVLDDLVRRLPMPMLVLPPDGPTAERIQNGVRHLLVPLDFTIASAVGLRTALDLSRRHGGRVTLVHALKSVPGHLAFSGSEARQVVRRLPAQLDAVASRLRRAAASLGTHEVDTGVATGDPARAIREAAAGTSPDLIVMGVASRSWLDRIVFGSTLRRVLQRATVPVLVVPVVAGDAPWPEEYGPLRISSSGGVELAADHIAA